MKKLIGALVALLVSVVGLVWSNAQWAGGNGGYVSVPVGSGTVVAGGTVNIGNSSLPSTISGVGGIHAVPPYPIWRAQQLAEQQGSISSRSTIPSGNWLAEGVQAYIVPMLAPNVACSYKEWSNCGSRCYC